MTGREQRRQARIVARVTHDRVACGLCGAATGHVGSHVLRSHLTYGATPERVRAMLAEERAARRLP